MSNSQEQRRWWRRSHWAHEPRPFLPQPLCPRAGTPFTVRLHVLQLSPRTAGSKLNASSHGKGNSVLLKSGEMRRPPWWCCEGTTVLPSPV